MEILTTDIFQGRIVSATFNSHNRHTDRWVRLWSIVLVFCSNICIIPCVLLLLQFVNLALFVLQIYYHFITNIWIIFVIILFEGLLGGAAYVNSFYQISIKVTTYLSFHCHFHLFAEHRES